MGLEVNVSESQHTGRGCRLFLQKVIRGGRQKGLTRSPRRSKAEEQHQLERLLHPTRVAKPLKILVIQVANVPWCLSSSCFPDVRRRKENITVWSLVQPQQNLAGEHAKVQETRIAQKSQTLASWRRTPGHLSPISRLYSSHQPTQ